MTAQFQGLTIATSLSLFCASCAVPQFDVPYTENGPTVDSVVRRIECEMREMVVEDDNNPASFNSPFLLTNDYVVAIALSLDVTNTGGLAPSLSYLNPVASFGLSGTGTLSEARNANFTENIQLSFRKIHDRWEHDHIPFECPSADTNLAGNLGIRDFVALAAQTSHLNQRSGSNSPEVFGGTVQFLVTKQINSFGPTWTLVHFVGPGSVNLSQVNTDKITLSFARGKEAGKPLAEHMVEAKANSFLQQLLTSQITSQLTTLQVPATTPSFFPFVVTRP
jgi:hypothetical protein